MTKKSQFVVIVIAAMTYLGIIFWNLKKFPGEIPLFYLQLLALLIGVAVAGYRLSKS